MTDANIDKDFTIKDFLADSISKWLDEKQSRNITLLSKKTKIHHTNIRRFINRKIENPSFESVCQILAMVLSESDFGIFLERYINKDIGKLVSKVFSERKNFKISDEESQTAILQNQIYNLVYYLSECAFTTRKEIYDLSGRIGLNSLDFLISSQILTEKEDGKIIAVEGNNFSLLPWLKARSLRYRLDQFEEYLGASKLQFVEFNVGRINLDTYKKMKNELEIFNDKISTLAKENDAKGTIPFYSGIVLSSFDPEKLKQIKKGKAGLD